MTARNPAAAIVHALRCDAAAHGVILAEIGVETHDWASATFVGHRHRLRATVIGLDAAAWLARLPSAEWSLPGRLIADIAVLPAEAGRIDLVILDLDDHRPAIAA